MGKHQVDGRPRGDPGQFFPRLDGLEEQMRGPSRQLVIEAISLSPVEVPRRATRVTVGWQSGTVTEIEVPRPHRRDLFRTPPTALARLRALAAAGRHDEEIA